AQLDPAAAQLLLYGAEVDPALLDAPAALEHPRVPVLRAARAERPVLAPRNPELAVAVAALRARAHPPRGLRTRHDAPGAVDGAEQQLLALRRVAAAQDHARLAHRRPHEALLARERRRAALADHPHV